MVHVSPKNFSSEGVLGSNQPCVNQTNILGHTLISCFILSVYLPDHQLRVAYDDDFL